MKISFDRNSCTLLLKLEENIFGIPDFVALKASELNLIKKPEFHVTIFGYATGKRISFELAKMSEEKREQALTTIQSLAEQCLAKVNLKEEFYILKKTYQTKDKGEETRESIIQMAEVGGLKEFIQLVENDINMHIDILPSHVTLFSSSTDKENMTAGIGINSEEDFKKLHPVPLFPPLNSSTYHTIALPTRSQPDTIIAIFILKHFGKSVFNGIEKAKYEVIQRMEEETDESLAEKGIIAIDVGGGMFDHHAKSTQTTASALIAAFLKQDKNQALSKLLQFAERDDFYGKGTLSTDPLDRAFGLSGLIGSLNKKYVNDPGKVIEIILPIIEAFYTEEEKRAFEMPKELEEKTKNGKAQTFQVVQRGKKLKVIFIETDNISMAGFLRSKGGGGYDVVALKLSSGHVNILTRPLQKVDLRSLAVLVRVQESEAKGLAVEEDPETFSIPGTLKEIPEWYYDPATNSLLNGGPNPKDITPTSIDPFEMQKILEIGLSEQLWQPKQR